MTGEVAICRDAAAIADEHYDVVVVGGGIYGILAALEAACRGLSTLVVEKRDFGAAASFNSLRTIHGGLRYLQRLDLPRAMASSRQRHWWLRNFPDLVVPINCLMPLYGRGLRRPAAFRAAFALTRVLGLNRGEELPSHRRLPPPRLLRAAEVQALLPAVTSDGLQGGASWSDAFMPDCQRVVIEALRWGVSAGARAVNYAEVLSASPAGSGSSRVRILDAIGDRQLEVTAATVINTTGAEVDAAAERLTGRPSRLLLPTVAWNLLLDAPAPSACSIAVTPPWPGARTYFLHPFRGRVLAGTGHEPLPENAAAEPDERMIAGMRADLDAALPAAGLGGAPVERVFSGVLPGVAPGHAELTLRPKLVWHSASGGGARVCSVLGVKFTEAPEVARRVLDAVTGRRSRSLPPRPAPAGNWRVTGTAEVSRVALLELAAAESAVHLEDLLERRTDAWCDAACARRLESLLKADFRERAA